ncbi:MAG TPA: hypothetical protein VKU60_00175, partial [Chloroflexota bacterium]|nr:hypothetical protein [Chloroflexota bacterium]
DDDSSIEALLLMPDMTMRVHHARDDAPDAPGLSEQLRARAVDGRDRYDEWKKRITEMLKPPEPPATKGKGG